MRRNENWVKICWSLTGEQKKKPIQHLMQRIGETQENLIDRNVGACSWLKSTTSTRKNIYIYIKLITR